MRHNPPPLRKTICKLNTCIIIYIIGSDKIILNESGDPFKKKSGIVDNE